MGDHRLAAVRRKYTSLGLGELTAAAVFVCLAAVVVLPTMTTRDAVLSFSSGLVPLLVVLVQAGTYWLLARGWVAQRPMPAIVARVYRGFRVFDPVLLVAGLIGVMLWLPTSTSVVLVVGVWLFAVVEYLNYFVVRLSYPIGSWPSQVTRWRKPRLVRDLDSAW